MSGIAVGRLTEERKNWRKDHPPGFYARPVKRPDNSTNFMQWEAGIPGKENTDWAGGVYKVIMVFPNDYPVKPPRVVFRPPLFHPNVFTSGDICLSILKEEDGWRSSITIKQILVGIQELLDEPNPLSAAHSEAVNLFIRNKAAYKRKIREQAAKNVPVAGSDEGA
eukprot:gene31864-38527_t